MTDKDKKHLAELRDQGYTYQQIAEASGIGLSSVKMFFKRNNTPADDSGLCAQCKKRLEKDAPKKKRFCSEKCRIKWWAEHPEQLSNAREHQYKCPVCCKVFYSYKPAKFCSLTCYHRSGERQVERMPKPNITGYLSSMALAGRMLDRKLIGRREFVSFEEKMRVRYGLEKGSIYRDHRLLCVPDRANITHCQEVIPWKNK